MKQIFHTKPKQWGLRGDQFLWDDMCEMMNSNKNPMNGDEFEQLFKVSFKKLTGNELKSKNNFFIEKYSHGGMSSGMICSDFWIEIALPLLKDRFINLHQ